MENIAETSGVNSPTGELGLSGSQSMAEMMYFHGNTLDNYRFTISGIVENDDLVLGMAICTDSDVFCKAKGRTISTGRALNQRKNPKGRISVDFYSDEMQNEFRGETGFPKDYFKGNEIKIFREFVWNYMFFTKKELQREFSLHRK